LECHHVEWLSCGGEDSIDNVVALCPNCHRRIHVLNDADDNMRLKKKLKLYH
jgi:5-methylcytosine-specific restriction protein A